MTKVTFAFDEVTRKWEATVSGVKTEVEGRQAFSAVVLTCQKLNPALLNWTRTVDDNGIIKIIPAV